MAEISEEPGPRYSRRLSVAGREVEVACGYDARGDRWAFHAYLVHPAGKKDRLHEVVGGEDTRDAALASAEREARAIVQFRFGQGLGIGLG